MAHSHNAVQSDPLPRRPTDRVRLIVVGVAAFVLGFIALLAGDLARPPLPLVFVVAFLGLYIGFWWATPHRPQVPAAAGRQKRPRLHVLLVIASVYLLSALLGMWTASKVPVDWASALVR